MVRFLLLKTGLDNSFKYQKNVALDKGKQYAFYRRRGISERIGRGLKSCTV